MKQKLWENEQNRVYYIQKGVHNSEHYFFVFHVSYQRYVFFVLGVESNSSYASVLLSFDDVNHRHPFIHLQYHHWFAAQILYSSRSFLYIKRNISKPRPFALLPFPICILRMKSSNQFWCKNIRHIGIKPVIKIIKSHHLNYKYSKLDKKSY